MVRHRRCARAQFLIFQPKINHINGKRCIPVKLLFHVFWPPKCAGRNGVDNFNGRTQHSLPPSTIKTRIVKIGNCAAFVYLRRRGSNRLGYELSL